MGCTMHLEEGVSPKALLQICSLAQVCDRSNFVGAGLSGLRKMDQGWEDELDFGRADNHPFALLTHTCPCLASFPLLTPLYSVLATLSHYLLALELYGKPLVCGSICSLLVAMARLHRMTPT